MFLYFGLSSITSFIFYTRRSVWNVFNEKKKHFFAGIAIPIHIKFIFTHISFKCCVNIRTKFFSKTRTYLDFSQQKVMCFSFCLCVWTYDVRTRTFFSPKLFIMFASLDFISHVFVHLFGRETHNHINFSRISAWNKMWHNMK